MREQDSLSEKGDLRTEMTHPPYSTTEMGFDSNEAFPSLRSVSPGSGSCVGK